MTAPGPGVARYTVYVQENGGAFTPWLVDTTSTSASFTGVDGSTFGFYSRATDLLGNQEPDKGVAESVTLVDAVDTDGDGILDFYDPDDDNDGIPDSVELAWGLDPLDAADALRDLDYDGSNALQEHQAGTRSLLPRERGPRAPAAPELRPGRPVPHRQHQQGHRRAAHARCRARLPRLGHLRGADGPGRAR